MISDYELAMMSQAIKLRLSYYEAISYAKILAESSIRYPIVEYLERRLSLKKLELEYTHPIFKRKRCDLYVEKGSGENTERVVFEFKYVKDTTSDLFQDYFDDIIRLHYLHNAGMQALFLVCGSTLNFNSQFRRTKNRTVQLGRKKMRPSGLFSRCLSFSAVNPQKSISTNRYRKYYNEFCNNYNFRQSGQIHPTTLLIRTRLIKLLNGFDQQSVGIWEVL
jgi:hypothetical protein